MPHRLEEAGHDALGRSRSRHLATWLEKRLGQGRPLDEDTRRRMEGLFGQTLHDVRLHDSEQAGEIASRLGAEAFTVEGHIFADPARLQALTPEGQGLMAHELTHVLQQTQPPPAPRSAGGGRRIEARPQGASPRAAHVPQFATQSAAASPSVGAPAEAEARANEERVRSAAEAAEAQERGQEVDVEEVADRVYRLMRRDLMLDRERSISSE